MDAWPAAPAVPLRSKCLMMRAATLAAGGCLAPYRPGGERTEVARRCTESVRSPVSSVPLNGQYAECRIVDYGVKRTERIEPARISRRAVPVGDVVVIGDRFPPDPLISSATASAALRSVRRRDREDDVRAFGSEAPAHILVPGRARRR